MATSTTSAQDFIIGAFPVMVGALASEDAEYLCQRNGLSFVELIRPFCQLDTGVQIHDPVAPSIVVPIKKLKIRVIDIQACLPADALVNRVLKEVVNRSVLEVNLESELSIDEQISAKTPWYEAYRNCCFQLLRPSSHEFLRDFFSCILVVSTRHPDPMNAFAVLSTKQNNIQYSTEKSKSYHWFSGSTFKYYVLLHDVSEGEHVKAEAVYQSMKSVYGSPTCFLLQINSRQKMFPQSDCEKMNFFDPWSQHIYPFTDDTLDIDESEGDETRKASHVQSQKDADMKEEAIVHELESIEKQIEQNQGNPKSLRFNDPLTSMHYNEDLDDLDALGPIKQTPVIVDSAIQIRRLSERSISIQNHKKTLQQFSYSCVTAVVGCVNKTERGQCMTLIDQDKIKAFVYEFIVRGLLPHMEKLMRNISEQILARRGIHKSIFNATKKWFGSSKQPATIGTNFNTGASYTSDSAELQYRKLGDLAFLVQHYELAYNSYHSAKRDFNNDHAWLHFAGALEMAAVSAFLQSSIRVYPAHYFEACISTYLNTCRSPDFASRACFMSTEVLKSKDMYPEAVIDFFKLTSEDSDLRSALLLEQAAHCFLRYKPPMYRKYAFHMVLAGHRFSKSQQRKHTLRCYIHALQIYRGKGWHLAEDHVSFIIGRQSFNLGNLDDAQSAMTSLLCYESEQHPSQQISHFREFLAIFKQNIDSKKTQLSIEEQPEFSLPILQLPILDSNSTRCLLHMPEQPIRTTTASPVTQTTRQLRTIAAGAYTFQKNFSKSCINRWCVLEQKIVKFVTGDLPYPFKPYMPCLSSNTDNRSNSIIGVNEQFAYEVQCLNPLKIPLNLLDLTLLWRFKADTNPDTIITNKDFAQDEYLETQVISNLQINPAEKKPVCIRLCVKISGELEIIGLKYTLSSVSVTNRLNEHDGVELTSSQANTVAAIGVLGMQHIKVKGPRLNSSKNEKANVMHGVDNRMSTRILSNLPLLQIEMSNIPTTLLSGEVQEGSFLFSNIGQVALKNLHIICSRTESISFGKQVDRNHYKYDKAENNIITEEESIVVDRNLENKDIVKIPLENNKLAPNGKLRFPVFIYGSDSAGVHEIDFLFYYEPLEKFKHVPYRLVQQMVRIQTLSTLNVSMESRVTCPTQNQQSDYSAEKQDLLLSLSIANRAQASMNLRCVEFTLKELVCYSCQWKVSSLVKLPEESFKLRPGETCSLHLKAISSSNNSERTATASRILFSEENQQTSTPSVSLDLFLKRNDNVQALLTSLGIILFWETFYIDESFTRHVINGQTHVVLNEPSKALETKVLTQAGIPILSPPSSLQGVTIAYEYSSPIQHNFDNCKLCMVPVTLKFSNQNDFAVQLEYEAIDLYDDECHNASTQHIKSSDIIQWGGHREGSIIISPNEVKTVTLYAVFTSVGVYEIQNVNVYSVNNQTNQVEKLALPLPKAHCISVHHSTEWSEK